MRRNTLTLIRDARPVHIRVLEVESAHEKLRVAVGYGSAVGSAFVNLCLSIALHRGIAHADDDDWESRPPGRVESEDEAIAKAISALDEALDLIGDLPIFALSAVLVRGARGSGHSPRSHVATVRLARSLEARAKESASAAALSWFAAALLDESSRSFRSGTPPNWEEWPSALRWLLVEVALATAVRNRDVDTLVRVGRVVLSEIIGFRPISTRVIRSCLTVSAAFARRHDVEQLEELGFQLRDALALRRDDEPDIAAFVDELERDPASRGRARILRELWDSALEPPPSSADAVLRRIREEYGATSDYERRVAKLGEWIRAQNRAGFEAAADLLESEVAWLGRADANRVAWAASASSVAGHGPGWAPSPIFASALRRTVIVGRSLAATEVDQSLGERADVLMEEALSAVRRAGGVTDLLEESHPMWSIEQKVVNAERMAGEKRFRIACDVWFEAACEVRDRLLEGLVIMPSGQVLWPTSQSGLKTLLPILIRLSDAKTDGDIAELVADLFAAVRRGLPGQAHIRGLRDPEGNEGGVALEALLGDIDRFREARHWRLMMRRWSASYISADRLPGLEHRDAGEVLEWLTMFNWDPERLIARLMLGLLEDSRDIASDGSVEALRDAGWFDRATSVDLDAEIWSQLRSPDVTEVLDIRERAQQLFVAATDASGGRFQPPSAQRLRDTALAGSAWEQLVQAVTDLMQKSRTMLRTRGHSRDRDGGLISVAHAARVLSRALLAEGELDFAAEFLVRGNAVIGELGHPFHYMSVVNALIGHDRSRDAARLLHDLDRDGGQVDLIAVTAVVSALVRTMAVRVRAHAPIAELEDYLETIEGLAQLLGPSRTDALLFSRLIGANVLLGRLERCEEIAATARQLGTLDAELEVQLLRARIRLAPDSVQDAVADATRRGAAETADLPAVVARALGGEGLLDRGLEWIEEQSHDVATRVRLFEALTEGLSLAGSHQGITGQPIDVEAVRRIAEGMYRGDLPITRNSLAAVFGAATRVAMAGNDSDRLVVAQESRRLISAAEAEREAPFGEYVVEQLAWLAKWTRSGKLAVDTVRVADALGLPWNSSRAGRLIEALAFSGDVAVARRLLDRGLEGSQDSNEQVYLYNVFLSVLRGRSYEGERQRVVEEMQARGLELDRFSRAEIGLGIATGGGLENESGMLRSSTAEKWNELVGPLREGAKLFEPIVARLRLELRTLERALESEKPADVLRQRCQDVADVSRELAESTKVFQESVSIDSEGVYSPTRYAITSDIVHELSQPAATLALQVRGLQRALDQENRSSAAAVLGDLLATAQLLGRKLKSYRDSLADADNLSAAEDDVSIFRVFSRAVEALDAEMLGNARFLGLESLKRDLKYDREIVVRGSAYLLQRVFSAMLTNSLEAMRKAATADPIIRLEALYHPSALVDGATFGTVQVFMSDSGPGIPEEIAEEVFKAGFSTRRQRGLGLGLATVASIVALHGGVVRLDSPANARFIIMLPAANIGRGAPDGAGIRDADDELPVRNAAIRDSDRYRDERAGKGTGTIVQLDTKNRPDAEPGGVVQAAVSSGWALISGLETPVKFYTERPDVAVGAVVEMSIRQTRSGPIGTDLVVSNPAPKGQSVIGVVERVPEQDQPFGFIYVPELGEQVVFFEDAYQGALDFDVGDPVSAILVPSFNWARHRAGLQAIQLERA